MDAGNDYTDDAEVPATEAPAAAEEEADAKKGGYGEEEVKKGGYGEEEVRKKGNLFTLNYE